MPWQILRKRFFDYTPEERESLRGTSGGPIERRFEWVPDTNFPVFELNFDAKKAYVLAQDMGFLACSDEVIRREYRAYYANWKHVRLGRVPKRKGLE